MFLQGAKMGIVVLWLSCYGAGIDNLVLAPNRLPLLDEYSVSRLIDRCLLQIWMMLSPLCIAFKARRYAISHCFIKLRRYHLHR